MKKKLFNVNYTGGTRKKKEKLSLATCKDEKEEEEQWEHNLCASDVYTHNLTIFFFFIFLIQLFALISLFSSSSFFHFLFPLRENYPPPPLHTTTLFPFIPLLQASPLSKRWYFAASILLMCFFHFHFHFVYIIVYGILRVAEWKWNEREEESHYCERVAMVIWRERRQKRGESTHTEMLQMFMESQNVIISAVILLPLSDCCLLAFSPSWYCFFSAV